MKTKITLLSLTLLLFLNGFSQMDLTFTATNEGQYVPLDSILIENLTQGGDTTLYAPDTVLSLLTTGIIDKNLIKGNDFSVSQNYPNPFKDQTSINLNLLENGKIEIHISDLLGREVASFGKILNKGIHTFTFYPAAENYYLLTVSSVNSSKTIKMLANPGNKRTSCDIVHTSYYGEGNGLKSKETRDDFVYMLGDELRYTGFAITLNEFLGSDIISDTPLKSESYEFDITNGIACLGMPTVTYMNQVYNTVQIGSQCWLKENLNAGTKISGSQNQTNNGIIEKYCYNGLQSNCDMYGGLYQWEEMMKYTSQPGTQGICPFDWHLPTDEDWKILEGEVDSQYEVGDEIWETTGYRGFDVGTNLKTTSGWDDSGSGTDKFGFSALPGGYRFYIDGHFYYIGTYHMLWTSSKLNTTGAVWYRAISATTPKVNRTTDTFKEDAFSVRCIRNY